MTYRTKEVSGNSTPVDNGHDEVAKPDPTTTPTGLDLPANFEVSSAGKESTLALTSPTQVAEVAAIRQLAEQFCSDQARHEFALPEKVAARAAYRDALLLDPGAEAYGFDPELFGIPNPVKWVGKKLAKVGKGLKKVAQKAIKAGYDLVVDNGLTMIRVAGKLLPLAVQMIGGPIAAAIYGKLSSGLQRAFDEWLRKAEKGGRELDEAEVQAGLRALEELDFGQETSAADTPTLLKIIDAAVPEKAEVIIDEDDRERVGEPSENPWRRICELRITFPTGAAFRGTGFLIGSRAVCTAAHCVYLHSQGGWAESVEVIPGSDEEERPFGSVVATDLRSVVGWVRDQDPESDYGCIILPEGSFAEHALGSFGFASLDDDELLGHIAAVAGYPGDKPLGQLWRDGQAITRVSTEKLFYMTDTVGGQSGSCVIVDNDGDKEVVGIHNYGHGGGNSATRITPARYERLRAWAEVS